LRAMGNQVTIGYKKTGTFDKIGHLTFVCEYLLGMPLVSALYFFIDESDVETVVTVGPCITISDTVVDLTIHKDTYMFVVPEWIRKCSGDVASVATTAQFQLLVHELESYISGTALVLGVKKAAGADAGDTLQDGQGYTVTGLNFGKYTQVDQNGVAVAG